MARDQQVVRLATVELQLPASRHHRCCGGRRHRGRRPSLLRVGEEHGGQIRAHRDARLLPGRAAIVRDDDVPALPDGDQAVACAYATPCSRLLLASGEACAGVSSTSTKPRAMAGERGRASAATSERTQKLADVIMIRSSLSVVAGRRRACAPPEDRVDVRRDSGLSARPLRPALPATRRYRAAARSCT